MLTSQSSAAACVGSLAQSEFSRHVSATEAFPLHGHVCCPSSNSTHTSTRCGNDAPSGPPRHALWARLALAQHDTRTHHRKQAAPTTDKNKRSLVQVVRTAAVPGLVAAAAADDLGLQQDALRGLAVLARDADVRAVVR